MVYEELCVRGATLERWSVTIRLKLSKVVLPHQPNSYTLYVRLYARTCYVTPRLRQRHRAVHGTSK